MQLPKIKCPRCNAYQKFGEQRREVGNNEIEVFVRCQMCRWEQVVIRGDSDKILNDRKVQRLRIRKQRRGR